MMIKDLSVSNELDGKAMSALCGGLQDTAQGNVSGSAGAIANGAGSIGTTAVSVVAPQQVNMNAPTFLNQPVAVALLGSTAFAI